MYTKKSGRMTYKTNRRPNFKRSNNYSSKGRNKGNVTQQYNRYLKLAKDTFSSGDRIQAEYYYQFTDHYYRLMLELGINIEDQEDSEELRSADSENVIAEEIKTLEEDDNQNSELENTSDDTSEKSIDSIPFISEPIKKKKTRASK